MKNKCQCQNIKKILDINNEDNFILLPKREMIYPMTYYFQCVECGHVYKFIKQGNTFEKVKE